MNQKKKKKEEVIFHFIHSFDGLKLVDIESVQI